MADSSQVKFDQLKNELLNCLKEDKFSEGLSLFKSCSEEQQKLLFQSLGAELKKFNNLAITDPKLITVIQRQLKPGKTFEDFYQAWKPPAEGLQIEKNKQVFSYFSLPARVINAQDKDNPSEILSIGLLWGENDEQFQAEMTKREKSEQGRALKIKEVADKLGSNKYYQVLTDDILGH